MAYDLPPPAAPPYSTSRSDAERNSDCGPGLGLNTMSCATSTSYGSALTCAGLVVTGVDGVVSCDTFFELFNFRKGFFEPFGKLAFNVSCFFTSSLNGYSFL